MVIILFKSGDAVFGSMQFATEEAAIAFMNQDCQCCEVEYDEETEIWSSHGYTAQIIEQ